MIWRPGKILRFKSDHAEEELLELAEEVHGRCKRTGKLELTITKTVRWPQPDAPRDLTERLSRSEIIEFGTNGHDEAPRRFFRQ